MHTGKKNALQTMLQGLSNAHICEKNWTCQNIGFPWWQLLKVVAVIIYVLLSPALTVPYFVTGNVLIDVEQGGVLKTLMSS